MDLKPIKGNQPNSSVSQQKSPPYSSDKTEEKVNCMKTRPFESKDLNRNQTHPFSSSSKSWAERVLITPHSKKTSAEKEESFFYGIIPASLIGGIIGYGFRNTLQKSLPQSLPPEPTVATIFAAISFGFGLKNRGIDFENLNDLEQLREEISKTSLSEALKNYGWDKIFTYNLVDPSQFQEAYFNLEARTESLEECVKLNLQANAALEKALETNKEASYSIPSLVSRSMVMMDRAEYLPFYQIKDICTKYKLTQAEAPFSLFFLKSKLIEELKSLSFLEAFHRYSEKDLQKMGISLSDEFWKDYLLERVAELSINGVLNEIDPNKLKDTPLSLDPDILVNKWEAEMESLSLKDAYGEYTRNKESLKGFGIDPSVAFWEEKFNKEVMALSFSQLIKNDNEEILQRLNLSLSPSFLCKKWCDEMASLSFREVYQKYLTQNLQQIIPTPPVEFWTRKWIESAKEMDIEKTILNMPPSDLVPHSEAAMKKLEERKKVSEEILDEKKFYLTQANRRLTESEKLSGIDMEKKEAEAKASFEEAANDLYAKEVRLREDYLMELMSSFPKSA